MYTECNPTLPHPSFFYVSHSLCILHSEERSHTESELLFRWCLNCVGISVYIPLSAEVYHKVQENGYVEARVKNPYSPRVKARESVLMI